MRIYDARFGLNRFKFSPRLRGPNPSGNSSSIVATTILFIDVDDMIIVRFVFESCADSKSICRHTPHGEMISLDGALSPRPMTAIVLNTLCPIADARAIAARSEHKVAPYDAFSTFDPVMISPDGVRRAEPTKKFEYGL